jgi:hypothetical protein
MKGFFTRKRVMKMSIREILKRGNVTRSSRPAKGRHYRRKRYTTDVKIPQTTGGDLYSYNKDLQTINFYEIKSAKYKKNW